MSPFGIAILLLLLLAFERVRGQFSLSRYRRAQAAKGAVLTIKDLTADVPKGDNGAPEVMDAARMLVDGNVLPANLPPRMKMTASGRAIVGFLEPEWVYDGTSNHWDLLAADLRTNVAALSRIRAALAKPVFDNHLDYAAGPNMRFLHLPKVKSLTYWLASGCQQALHEGRIEDATGCLVAEIRLQHMVAQDRLLISELVRIALAAIARADTWEALQADGWTDAALLQLQKAWKEPCYVSSLARSLEGERVFASVTFDRLRRSNQETINVFFALANLGLSGATESPAWKSTLENLPGGQAVSTFMKEQVYCRIWRFAWLDQSECRYLRKGGDLIDIARQADNARSVAVIQPASEAFLEEASNPGFYHRLRFPSELMSLSSLTRAISRSMRAETEKSLVLAAIAVKRYTLKHGRPPESLSVMVPDYLSTVPTDYMDGKPIRYQLNADGTTVLYSVGEDATDNGGDARLKAATNSGQTIWDRKDCVWPAPALPEEVEAYRAKALRSD